MNLTGNTIFITGGGSGIGRALAEALHQRGNQVIISGRRQGPLDEVTAANPGMKSIALDIQDPASIAAAAARLTAEFPALNVLVNNAGIMRAEDLKALKKAALPDAEAIVTTNLLGPIRMTAALLPHLLRQSAATIVNVSSGLGFVPMAMTPTYSATKAALHSYTMSLRYQLRDTSIKVLEIIPPWVATELMGPTPTDSRAMPLDKFIAETMEILATDAEEICVQNVMFLRNAAKTDEAGIFTTFNDRMSSTVHQARNHTSSGCWLPLDAKSQWLEASSNRELLLFPPLNVAADAIPLIGVRLLAGDHCVHGRAQVLAGDGNIVAAAARPVWAAVVELAAIRQLHPGVVQEEVGRAGSMVGARHLLRLVVEVGKQEAQPQRLLLHVVRRILGMRRNVI